MSGSLSSKIPLPLVYVFVRPCPVGSGMIKVPIVPFYPTTLCELNATIRPSLRDGPFFAVFQAINCLATIIRSLRDKIRNEHVEQGNDSIEDDEDGQPRRRLGGGGRTSWIPETRSQIRRLLYCLGPLD
jgi:hypothetical protein